MATKRACENCRIAKQGADRILAGKNLLEGEGLDTSCVTCSRNLYGSILGDLFGPKKDNWQPLSKPEFQNKESKNKGR